MTAGTHLHDREPAGPVLMRTWQGKEGGPVCRILVDTNLFVAVLECGPDHLAPGDDERR